MEPKASSSLASSKYVVEFDGTNYTLWAIQMLSWLQSHGLGKYISERAKELMDRARDGQKWDVLEELEDGDEKALGHIKCHISQNFLNLVVDCKSAFEAWKKLKEFFDGKESFNKFGLLEMLIDGKFEDTGKPVIDVQKFLNEKMQLVQRLNGVGFKVPEDFQIAIILCRLPGSFEAMRRVFESQTEPTLLKLTTELNKEAVRRKRKREESAMMGDHEDDKKPPRKIPKTMDKRKTVCSNCKMKGHDVSKCWFNKDCPSYRPELLDKLVKAAAATRDNAPQE